MKKIVFGLLSLLLVFSLVGCTQTSVSVGISCDDFKVGYLKDSGFEVLKDNTVNKGDTIALVFINAGTFTADSNGKYGIGMDTTIVDDSGVVLLDSKNMLGDDPVDLPDGVAQSPYASVSIPSDSKSEIKELTVSVKLYDKNAKGFIEKSVVLKVNP